MEKTKANKRRKKLLFILGGISICLLSIECILQGLAKVSKSVRLVIFPYSAAVLYNSDEALGHRPNPEYIEHDHRGFRNASEIYKADIVAMGDSQTYGIPGPMDEAWPQQVQAISKNVTYNMAFGGYSPAHSLILLDEALSLKPSLIIEAVYSGNDLYDGFNIVYYTKKLPRLGTQDPAALAAIKEAEAKETLEHISYRTGDRFSPICNELIESRTAKASGLRQFVAENCASYGMIRAAYRALTKKPSNSPEDWTDLKTVYQKKPEYYQVLETDRCKCILMSAYRLGALDQRDCRITEGQRVQIAALKELNKRVTAAGVKFAVVCIPTTEMVMEDVVKTSNAKLPSEYSQLITNEKQFWSDVKNSLESEKVPIIDPLPALKRAVSEGHQPYYMRPDGHPNSVGYRAIAETVCDELRRANLMPGSASETKK